MTTPRAARPAIEKPALAIKNLTKKYGPFTALDDLTLTLASGQIMGLIGPNRAGKAFARPQVQTATVRSVRAGGLTDA